MRASTAFNRCSGANRRHLVESAWGAVPGLLPIRFPKPVTLLRAVGRCVMPSMTVSNLGKVDALFNGPG
jgi:hypothetical protein